MKISDEDKIKSFNIKDLSSKMILEELEERELELELLLSGFGMHKINPDNPNDMVDLLELSKSPTSSYSKKDIANRAAVPPPDFAVIANLYTLYKYTGNYSYKGSTYEYSYIRVVDNKGYNGLTVNAEFNAAPKTSSQTVINNVLKHNFQYVLSAYLGTKPNGWIASWTIGSIWSILDSVPSSVMANSNYNIYRIFQSSVTEMIYYYVYNEGYGWVMVGVSGNASYAKTDFCTVNYNGSPLHLTNGPNYTSSSSSTLVWNKYIESYADQKDLNPYYSILSEFGSFQIKGYESTHTFTPAFCRYPLYL